MNDNPPAAFIGWGHDARTGEFFMKVCPQCEEVPRALVEAGDTRVKLVLCDHHFYEFICAKMGESKAA